MHPGGRIQSKVAAADTASREASIGVDAWRASALPSLIAWNLGSMAAAALLLTWLARDESAFWPVMAGTWCFVLALGALAIARRLAWRIRAVLFLALNIGLVILSATSLRPRPAAFATSLAVVALAGLLLGGRAAVGTAIFSALTLSGAALLAASGVPPRPVLHGSLEWLLALLGSLPAMVLVVLALRSIVGRLETALGMAIRTVGELEAARSLLVESEKAELTGKVSRALAHDLNNTLTVVMANAEWLTEHLGESEDREAASQISEAARNAATLTQYALLASRGGMAQPRPVELTRATAIAASALKRLLPPDIAVEARLAGPVWAQFDPGQYQHILLSLAFNARGAMPGGGAVVLSVRAAGPAPDPGEPPPAAILEVSDNGLGLDPEERRRAFDPPSASGVRRGAAFGLAGVKAMVEAGGGEIMVRSRPGAGTAFTVTLPGAAAALPATPGGAARRARVLVVEDDIRVRALICTALAEAGHEVSEVSDGTQAMRAIEELPRVDLLVTDVVMPGVAIGEVLMTFRSRHPAGRILVCSANTEDDGLRQRVAAGEYRLLSKPFSRSDLVAAVQSLLSAQDGREQPRERDAMAQGG